MDSAKYKRRLVWLRTSIEDAVERGFWQEANDDVYWDVMWRPKDEDLDWVVLHVPKYGYVVTPDVPNSPREKDLGPYKRLYEAIAVAETVAALGGKGTE